jgi:hypothetical protein
MSILSSNYSFITTSGVNFLKSGRHFHRYGIEPRVYTYEHNYVSEYTKICSVSAKLDTLPFKSEPLEVYRKPDLDLSLLDIKIN